MAGLILALCLFLTNVAFAESRTFVQEYSHQAMPGEDKTASRLLALMGAKKLLLADVADFLQKETAVQKWRLTRKQVIILAAGFVPVQALEENFTGQIYKIKVQASFDTGEIVKSMEKLGKDKVRLKYLKEAGCRADALSEENRKRQEELAAAKGEEEAMARKRYENSLTPLFALEWLEKANARAVNDNDEAAVQDYSKAVLLLPDEPVLYFLRGYSYKRIGIRSEVIDNFSKALELGRGDDEIYEERGFAYYELGALQEALADYDELIKARLGEALPYVLRGFTYYALGRCREAVDDFSQAILLHPEEPLLHCMRGDSYYVLGQYSEALADFSKAIAASPQEAFLYSKRSGTYLAIGRYEDAIADVGKIIEARPHDVTAYNYRGYLYGTVGKSTEAVADYTKAIHLDPDLPYPYKQLGVHYSKIGKLDDALRYLSKAIELSPLYADAYYARAVVHAGNLNAAKANQDLGVVLRIKPALRNTAIKDRAFENIKNSKGFRRLFY